MMSELLEAALRRIVSTSAEEFLPYERYGAVNPGLEWLPLSGDMHSEEFECFLIRMKPGGSSTPHEHTGHEEFLLLDGELEDCDGTVFRAGDFVSYSPGSKHYSVSPKGCLMLVMLRGRNRALAS
jgi:anti-sigma factor ChrR (cupin superfamily)